MGNIQGKEQISRDFSLNEDPDQDIIPTDTPVFLSTSFDPPPVVKPINNILIPKLRLSKSIFVLKKDTVYVTPVGKKFTISFEYDSNEKTFLRINFAQRHLSLTNGVPKEIELEVGKNVKFELDFNEISRLKNVNLESCSFTSERKFVPILIVVTSPKDDFTYYAMCGLKKDPFENWRIFVTKRRIKVGSYGYQIQEVYGLNESEYSDKAENKDERVKNCSICLDTPSNTILMPCRHICLCSKCSITVSTQFGVCPMCRTCVNQIIHINNDSK